MNEHARRRFVNEAVAARTRADSLLRQLIAASAECDSQLEQQNRQDPIRLVTGRSALDRAIHETRRMIDTLDRAINDADRAEPGLLVSIAATLASLRVPVARPSVA